MKDDVEQTLYDQQITTVIQGFMQVWNKFEATLYTELAQVQKRLEGMHPERELYTNTNYELFYRVSNSNTDSRLVGGQWIRAKIAGHKRQEGSSGCPHQ